MKAITTVTELLTALESSKKIEFEIRYPATHSRNILDRGRAMNNFRADTEGLVVGISLKGSGQWYWFKQMGTRLFYDHRYSVNTGKSSLGFTAGRRFLEKIKLDFHSITLEPVGWYN